jgi:hypothetical protein
LASNCKVVHFSDRYCKVVSHPSRARHHLVVLQANV